MAVIRLEGYQRKHSVIKSIPSAGQFVIIDYRPMGEYSGKLIPLFAACFSP
jgi:hypothetical protein